MPVVKFEIRELERLLGKPVPRADLAKDIPQIGADVEDAKGETWAVEFFPNRPDLYTVEGIARAMRAFYGFEPGLRRYHAKPSGAHVAVDPSVEKLRPFISAAFVRGVDVTQARLDALIGLQEDLHWGLGARRRRVAIGVHDAAALAPPFTYGTVALDHGAFVPLQETAAMTPREIVEKHPKGKEYAHLVAGEPRIPIILDAKGGVVSLPPIINAARTTVSTSTRDLFLDVTGTDEWAVSRALNILATALVESGGALESVEIRRGAKSTVTPDLAPEPRDLSVADANALLGLDLDAAGVAQRLQRMGHGARPDGATVHVEVPPYRADVLHAWDLIEDVAIGHGISTFTPLPLRTPTVGMPLPENRFAENARRSMVGLGFLETMGLTLSNPRDQFARMRRPASGVVQVKNPVTEDTTMLRPSLLPSLLTVLRRNAHRDLPQRLFEVAMVTHLDGESVVNERRIAGAMIQGRSNFSEVKGVVLALARDLSWADPVVAKADDPAFVMGRCASLAVGGHPKGVFGELHPEVLDAWGLTHPVMAFELHLARGPGSHVRGPHAP